MTLEDIIKITAAVGSAPLTVIVIKWLSDRKAAKEEERKEEIDGNSSIQIAALGTFKDVIAAYQQRQHELTEENRALRRENRSLRERHETLSRIANPIAIVLIEDEPGIVEVIKRFLDGSEFTVTACSTWNAAALHLTTSPDIAIVDLALPDSTPEETIARVSEYKTQHPSVPIGIITGTTLLDNIICPQGVKIAHKNDIMQSAERFKSFLYSVLNY